MTQAAVADHLGVTQQTYAQLEANPTAVSVERLLKVLRVLGVGLVLSPSGIESQPDTIATEPSSAQAPQSSAKNIRARKTSQNVAPAAALGRAPAPAGKKTRSPAGTGTAGASAKKRPLPPKPVIKKREDW